MEKTINKSVQARATVLTQNMDFLQKYKNTIYANCMSSTHTGLSVGVCMSELHWLCDDECGCDCASAKEIKNQRQ